MILNAYAVLDAFVSLLRLGLGLIVLGLGIEFWRWRTGPATPPSIQEKREDRSYLLFMLAGLLLALNVVAWPLFYLLLQSYVPQWPGVMCIYGVTRVGAGSVGPSRFLPTLVTALQVMKPALVFLSGAWFVLYLLNRHTRTAPLTGRVVAILMASVLLVMVDAVAEVTYLAIPKTEQFLSGGCCTEAFDAVDRAGSFLPNSSLEDNKNAWLYAAYYAVNLGMILALGVHGRLAGSASSWRWLGSLLVGALLCMAVNSVFLIDAAAPRLLHLPYHHCPYDLVPRVPESMVAVALFLAGCFCIGWACIVSWLGRGPEARPFLAPMVGRLLYLAFLGYGGSLLMISLELALA